MAIVLSILILGSVAYLMYHEWRLAFALLFFLLPTYTIRFNIGPLPTTLLELIIWTIFMVWVIKTLKHKSIKTILYRVSSIIYHHKSLFIAISIFLLAATYSAFFTSINLRAALGEWKAFYIEPFLVFLILIVEGTKDKEQYRLSPISYLKSFTDTLLLALVLSGLVTSLLAIYQHFTGFMVPYSFWANRATYRVTGWYGYPNAVGLFLAPLIPLALFLFAQSFSKLKEADETEAIVNFQHWPILISSFLFLISTPLAIIFAKSTGAIIGTIAGIGALLLMYKKTRWPTLICGIVAIITLVLMPNNAIKTELLAQDRSGQIRIAMWGEATEYLSRHPISGAGLASYATLIAPYHAQVNGENIEIFSYQHNIFLSMWISLGLFGLIGFLWIVVWFFRVGLMEIRNQKLETRDLIPKISNPACRQTGFQSCLSADRFPISPTPYLISSMTTLVVTGLVDTPYMKNDLSLFFWVLVGLLFINTQNEIQKI